MDRSLTIADFVPEPLLPADVDLRDFQFLPLDVNRFRDSSLVAKRTGDEIVAAILLWSASWHQQPASSLPNDDVELARLAGYGRGVKDFKRIYSGAMHRLVLCRDGRWYHPVVAEKAVEAWNSKIKEGWRKQCDLARKENKERESRKLEALPMPARPPLLIQRNQGEIPSWEYDYSDGIPAESQQNSSGQSARNSRRNRTEGTVEGKVIQKQQPGARINGHAKGTRLAETWTLPDEWRDWATAYRTDWDEQRVLRESLVFRDYWLGKAGANASKANWLSTWRNWIRRAT